MKVTRAETPGYESEIHLQYWGDDRHPGYMLVGERFKEDDILLDLMMRYDGACRLGATTANDVTRSECNFNCNTCPHSIYQTLEVKRRQFMNKVNQLVSRVPKKGDEWELSVVMQCEHHPRYETYYWECEETVESDEDVCQIIVKTMEKYNPDIFTYAQLQYVKYLRFDAEKPVDISVAANPKIRKLHANHTSSQ